MLLPLMLTGALAQAAEPDRIHGLRLGLCGGISTECLLVSAKVEYAWKRAAINLSFPVVPVMGGANLKLYPLNIQERDALSWRPYVYGGVGTVFFLGGVYGGGAGADIHLLESRGLIIQPSLGVVHDGILKVSGAASVMYGF
jgi:hypothetical protein